MTKEQLFGLERRLLAKYPTWIYTEDNNKLTLVVHYPKRGFIFYKEGGEE